MLTNHQKKLGDERRPGPTPAFSILCLCVVESFLLTQTAFGFDPFYQTDASPYTPPTETGHHVLQDARDDHKRVYERNQRLQLLQSREKENRQQNERQAQQAQEVERGVQQDTQIQLGIADQEKQQADQI